MNRQITCSANTPDDVRARLSELYDRQLDPNTFQGSFGETLPEDVGGFGKYVHLDSPMGRVCIYVERFRGQDNQALDIEKAFSSVDLLVDLLIEWLQTELGEHPNFEKLRVFCDEALREDLKNISLYSWLYDRASGESDETSIRILLYLYERNYITLDDIVRMNSSIDHDDFALSYFRRMIASKLELRGDKKVQEELEFLQDPNALTASLNRFIASDIFHDRFASYARERAGDSDLVLDPCDIPETIYDMPDMFSEIFFLDFFRPSGDKVTVKLAWLGDPNVGTNGQWDEQTGQLIWSNQSEPDELPFLCYAFSGLANESFQEEHFGKVALQDERLFQYSFWYKGLNPEQQTKWDDFIAGLDGGEDVSGKVESFRFKSAATPSADSDRAAKVLSDIPRGLIGQGLKANEEGGQELNGPGDITEQD